MTEVVFLSSVQGYQAARVREVAERLSKERPDLTVKVLSPEESGPALAQKKLKFGPAVLVAGRLEFVGIPRYRMLLTRIETSIERAKNPPPPEPPAAPAPAPKPAAPSAVPAAAPPAKPSS